MAKNFETYWYQESPFIRNAFLCHCRDGDVQRRSGAKIEQGAIIPGAVGVAAAEQVVPGFTANPVAFNPTRRCDWQGIELQCMVHPEVPAGAKTKKELRHFNNAVAELPDDAAARLASSVGVPVVTLHDGRRVINIELSSFQRQGIANPRRAKLL